MEKAVVPEGLLGLTAEFDVKSGYLLVEGEGVLGKQHRGKLMQCALLRCVCAGAAL